MRGYGEGSLQLLAVGYPYRGVLGNVPVWQIPSIEIAVNPAR